jgi:UDP-glucose 4-epimerase
MGPLLRAARDGMPFTVHGTTYDTPDGTCIRDYVHVMDVAAAHVLALERAQGLQSLNVGTGRGTSVRELVATMAEVSGQELDVREGPARAGDVAISTAATGRIAEALRWQATRSLGDMCRSAWQASLRT